MKNFIRSCLAYCIKVTGYLTAHDPRKTTKSFGLLNTRRIFFIKLTDCTRIAASLYLKIPVLLAVVLLNISAINAQQDVNYALHANIIYRFTKYIDWPGNYNSGDFVIGIVGETPLYEVLEEFVVNKTVGNRKIIIKKMPPAAESYKCNILFISGDKSRSLKKIAEVTKGSPILIISENNGLALKGSCINFVIADDHLRLEINKSNIEARNLNIASELLSLGTIVK